MPAPLAAVLSGSSLGRVASAGSLVGPLLRVATPASSARWQHRLAALQRALPAPQQQPRPVGPAARQDQWCRGIAAQASSHSSAAAKEEGEGDEDADAVGALPPGGQACSV